MPPLTLPGAYLSPSAVHQAPTVAPGDQAATNGAPVAGMSEPTASPETRNRPPAGAMAMPLAGTPEPGTDTLDEAAKTAPSMAPTTAVPGGAAAGSGTPRSGTGPRAGDAPLFADLPFDAPSTLVGWLITLGSGLAAISFLLPWAPGIVSYTSSWGLSSLANLPILALLVATVILAILPSPVPHWIRSAILPLIGGSMFLGLLWPYLVGDFGAEFGSIIGAGAGVVLVIGGILATAPRPSEAPGA